MRTAQDQPTLDPTRPVQVWQCHREPSSFIRSEMDQFLKGYYRDLQQSQANHFEIVGEKKTAGIYSQGRESEGVLLDSVPLIFKQLPTLVDKSY